MNDAKCEECHENCETCEGSLSSNCLSCANPNRLVEDDCTCKEGFYLDSTCEECHSDCLTCAGPLNTDCITCKGANKEVSGDKCECKEGYCLEDDNCIECVDRDSEYTDEGVVGAASLLGAIFISFISLSLIHI